MSDKANTPQPDRAGDGFDDLDVPTYAPQKPGSEKPVSEKPVPEKTVPEQSSAADKATPGAGKPATAGSGTASLYERIGRAAPQSIPANPKPKSDAAAAEPVVREPSSAETASFAAASRAAATGTGAAGGGAAVTSTAKAGNPAEDKSEPLRSDAPTTSLDRSPTPGSTAAAAKTTQIPRESSYKDTDFAPTSSGATVQPFTQSTPESSPQPFDQPANAPTTTSTAAGGLYTGGAVAAADEDTSDTRGTAKDGKRGTIDFGLLMIRVLLGAYLVLTSVATFFQLGGNEGLAGLESQFAGYVLPNILAILVPSMQLAAGVFLIFGLITPLFAALATVVTSFTALHALADSGAGLNIFAWDDSVMLSIILLVISLALQFTGPGLYSFDFGRGWARRPLVSSWIFVVLGIAGAVALWWFGAGVNPLN
ncbi:DoxX family membrane protein [Corynebacterium sp. A21]|uniref:DoxX family membrane protein n=1 Tax=Corynebacterium sp. A21 TaxID=3457318 RepID=UPI003FD2786D